MQFFLLINAVHFSEHWKFGIIVILLILSEKWRISNFRMWIWVVIFAPFSEKINSKIGNRVEKSTLLVKIRIMWRFPRILTKQKNRIFSSVCWMWTRNFFVTQNFWEIFELAVCQLGWFDYNRWHRSRTRFTWYDVWEQIASYDFWAVFAFYR